MPEISRFFGIVISIFYDDHNPPHFHAKYGEFKTKIDIQDLRVLEGFFPSRALGLVVEWASSNRENLLDDWELAKNGKQLLPIEPLK